MRAKKYLWSILCVYFCYLTHGIQAIILSQNNVNFAKRWGFNMADPQSAAYAAGRASGCCWRPSARCSAAPRPPEKSS